jgi:hypothetical protein
VPSSHSSSTIVTRPSRSCGHFPYSWKASRYCHSCSCCSGPVRRRQLRPIIWRLWASTERCIFQIGFTGGFHDLYHYLQVFHRRLYRSHRRDSRDNPNGPLPRFLLCIFHEVRISSTYLTGRRLNETSLQSITRTEVRAASIRVARCHTSVHHLGIAGVLWMTL